MTINFNPNLPPNDSLEPWQIEAKVAARNAETRKLTEQALKTGGVPPSTAERAADHSSIARQTPEAKKARRDARTWWRAKNKYSEDCE
jgi:DNA-binding ferritin-like protein